MSVYLPQVAEITDQTSDHYNIRFMVNAVDIAMEGGETGLVIGQCKGMMDSVCKSILSEKNLTIKPDANSNKLAKDAISALDVAVGVENDKKAKDAFKKMVSQVAQSVENAIAGLQELRNDFCPVAHGKPHTHVPLDIHYAKFITGYVDNTIAFIHQLKVNATEPPSEINYQLNTEFNDNLNDDLEPYELFGETYLASEIIFNLNPKQYKELLEEYNSGESLYE